MQFDRRAPGALATAALILCCFQGACSPPPADSGMEDQGGATSAASTPETEFRATPTGIDRVRRWRYGRTSPGPATAGNLYVATGDVNRDGHSDIIVGAPAGQTWGVAIFDGRSDQLIKLRSPFGTGYAGGVAVAAGDYNGDGHDDILCATATSNRGNVLYSGATLGVLRKGLQPFGSKYNKGLSVAAGDIDGDGRAELVMAQSAGGLGRIVVYRGGGGVLAKGLSPFGNRVGAKGVSVATADLDQDGRDELIAGTGRGVRSTLSIYQYDRRWSVYAKNLRPFGESKCGFFIAGGDVNGDRRDDVLLGSACGGKALAYTFANKKASVLPPRWHPFGRSPRAGARVAVASGLRPLVFAPHQTCGGSASCPDALPLGNLQHVIPFRVNFGHARLYQQVVGKVSSAMFDLKALGELSPSQRLKTPVVVHLHWHLFDGPNYRSGLPRSREEAAHYSVATDIDRVLSEVEPHLRNISALFVADEPYRWGLRRKVVEQAIARVKARFPGIPTWVNFSHDCFDRRSSLPQCSQSVQAADRGIPAKVDWVSFDSYAWDLNNACGSKKKGGSLVARCFDELVKRRVVRLTQLTSKPIMLVTESAAFNLSTKQQIEHFDLAANLAGRYRQVTGIAAYQWGDMTYKGKRIEGIASQPALRAHILTYSGQVLWQSALYR